jgi:hypothetical protein
MKMYLLVARMKDYVDANYRVIGSYKDLEIAEAQRDLHQRIVSDDADYNYYIFDGEVEDYEQK